MKAFKVFNPLWIRELRIKRKMTQAELGHLTGLAVTTIAGAEKGRKEPMVSTLAMIAGALKVKIDYFFID